MIKKFKDFVIEASAQAKRNKLAKNTQDTIRGARHNVTSPTPLDPEDSGHKTRQAMNKAIGRALRREELDESASSGTLRDQIKAHIHNEWKQDTLSGYTGEDHDEKADLEHETSKTHAHALKHKITDPKKAYDHYTDHAYGHITKAIEKAHANTQARKKKMN